MRHYSFKVLQAVGYVAVLAFVAGIACLITILVAISVPKPDVSLANVAFLCLFGFILAQAVGWIGLRAHCESALWFSTRMGDPATKPTLLAKLAWWLGITSLLIYLVSCWPMFRSGH
jgi:hypothetical protein